MPSNICEHKCTKLFLIAIEWITAGSSLSGLLISIFYYVLIGNRLEPKFLSYSLYDWNLYFTIQNATITCGSAFIISLLLCFVTYGFDNIIHISLNCSIKLYIIQIFIFVFSCLGGLCNFIGYFYQKQNIDDISFGFIVSGCVIQIIMSKVYRWIYFKVLFDQRDFEII